MFVRSSFICVCQNYRPHERGEVSFLVSDRSQSKGLSATVLSGDGVAVNTARARNQVGVWPRDVRQTLIWREKSWGYIEDKPHRKAKDVVQAWLDEDA